MPPTEEAIRLARLQAIFYIATGVWPFVSIRTFEAVTGPKVDRWLVKTVGALVAVIGCALALASRRRQLAPEIVLVAGRQRGGLGHDRHRLRRQAPHLARLPARRGRRDRAGRRLGAALAAEPGRVFRKQVAAVSRVGARPRLRRHPLPPVRCR